MSAERPAASCRCRKHAACLPCLEREGKATTDTSLIHKLIDEVLARYGRKASR